MKAAVFHEYGGVDKLLYEDIDTPEPGFGEVLKLVAEGKLDPVIHSTWPLKDVREAASLAADRKFFGQMVLIP